MAQINVEVKFENKENGELRDVKITTFPEEDYKRKLWVELSYLTRNTLKEVKKSWSIVNNTVYVEYKNPPWDDFDDMKKFLQDLDDVCYVRYESPLEGSYSPPKFHVKVKTSEVASRVKDEINEYYSGLDVKTENRNIEVIAYNFMF